MFGHTEILVILLVILIVFGASRLPALGRGLGEGLRGFKDGLKGEPPEGDKAKGQGRGKDDDADNKKTGA